MLLRKSGINPSVLLRGIGVELTSHRIQAVQDVKGLPLVGAFKQGVLNEMRNAGFTLRSYFVPRACIDDQSAMRYGAVHMFVDDPKPVFELRSVELFLTPVGQRPFKHVGHGGC